MKYYTPETHEPVALETIWNMYVAHCRDANTPPTEQGLKDYIAEQLTYNELGATND